MRESYREGLASHSGPESCAVGREAGREALTGVCAGRALSHETFIVRGADAVSVRGRQHPERRQGETRRDPAGGAVEIGIGGGPGFGALPGGALLMVRASGFVRRFPQPAECPAARA